MDGIFGMELVGRNPLCLKLTMSPCCGLNLFTNSVVPAGATKRTPLGLSKRSELLSQEGVDYAYSSHSHCEVPTEVTIRASASRNFCSNGELEKINK